MSPTRPTSVGSVGAGDRLQDVGERAQLRVGEAAGEVLADPSQMRSCSPADEVASILRELDEHHASVPGGS